MKRISIVVSLVLGFLLGGCDKPEAIEYVDFYDIPCGLSKSVTDETNENGYELTYNYVDGVLEIDFSFLNTCGAAYQDSICIDGNSIRITLADTSSYHARCICTHRSVFDFSVSNYDAIHLEIMIDSISLDAYSSGLDTVLQLYNYQQPIP